MRPFSHSMVEKRKRCEIPLKVSHFVFLFIDNDVFLRAFFQFFPWNIYQTCPYKLLIVHLIKLLKFLDDYSRFPPFTFSSPLKIFKILKIWLSKNLVFLWAFAQSWTFRANLFMKTVVIKIVRPLLRILLYKFHLKPLLVC